MDERCERCEDIEEWGAMPLYKELELYGPEDICEECEISLREAVESAKVDDEIDRRRGN